MHRIETSKHTASHKKKKKPFPGQVSIESLLEPYSNFNVHHSRLTGLSVRLGML